MRYGDAGITREGLELMLSHTLPSDWHVDIDERELVTTDLRTSICLFRIIDSNGCTRLEGSGDDALHYVSGFQDGKEYA